MQPQWCPHGCGVERRRRGCVEVGCWVAGLRLNCARPSPRFLSLCFPKPFTSGKNNTTPNHNPQPATRNNGTSTHSEEKKD
jgi:hypothetical protein